MENSVKFVKKVRRSIDELVRIDKKRERAIAEFFPNYVMKIDDSELYRQAEIKIAAIFNKVVAKDIKNIQIRCRCFTYVRK